MFVDSVLQVKIMGLFCEQPAYCLNCGKPFMTNFQFYKGTVCSEECGKEMQWKETLYIMGKEYYQQPVKDEETPDKLSPDPNIEAPEVEYVFNTYDKKDKN